MESSYNPVFRCITLQSGPKKVSHYHESSLTRIKTRRYG